MGEPLAAFGLPMFIGYGIYIAEVVAPILLFLGVLTRAAGLVIAFDLFMAILLVRRDGRLPGQSDGWLLGHRDRGVLLPDGHRHLPAGVGAVCTQAVEGAAGLRRSEKSERSERSAKVEGRKVEGGERDLAPFMLGAVPPECGALRRRHPFWGSGPYETAEEATGHNTTHDIQPGRWPAVGGLTHARCPAAQESESRPCDQAPDDGALGKAIPILNFNLCSGSCRDLLDRRQPRRTRAWRRGVATDLERGIGGTERLNQTAPERRARSR